MRRRRLTLILTTPAALSGLLSAAPAPSAAAASADQRPVILVHGYNAGPGVWGALAEELKASGYSDSRLFRWSYDSSPSVNETLSGQFAAYVDTVRRQTGADQVDIVAHSFGSLVTRRYLKFGGGTAHVAHWISLGGPNHGTYTAWACAAWDQACRDMSPGSYVQDRLADGDETPGATRYSTFWSPCDEVIDPDDSVPLTGATSTGAGCLDHDELFTDDGVSQGVRAFLATP
ncbi:esterase/lipase family protein [Streptomyces sp. NPDC055400]